MPLKQSGHKSDQKLFGGAIAPCHHLDLEQPTFQCAVVERRLFARSQAHQFGHAKIGGEEIAVPAGKVALQSRA